MRQGLISEYQRVGSYSISGTVLGPSGSPVNGAGVNAYSLDESGRSTYSPSRDGAFTLRGLTPGRYIIKAWLGDPHQADLGSRGRELEVGYASADVELMDITGIDVTLSKPARAVGRVVFAGSPAPRASLLRMVVQTRAADDRWWSSFEGRPAVSPVSDSLTFELTGLYRRPLLVGIHGLPDGWALQSVRDQERDITHVPTDFGSRASTAGLEIVLTNRVAQPSIRVTDQQGAPVTAYQVVAVPADPARWKLALAVVPGAPTRDGILKAGAMLPGDYLFAALPPDELLMLMRDPARIDALAGAGTRVALQERDERTIELRLVTLTPAR